MDAIDEITEERDCVHGPPFVVPYCLSLPGTSVGRQHINTGTRSVEWGGTDSDSDRVKGQVGRRETKGDSASDLSSQRVRENAVHGG